MIQSANGTVSMNLVLHAKTVGSPVNKLYVRSSGPANPACDNPRCVKNLSIYLNNIKSNLRTSQV
jgi:hypothetical protein